MQYFPLFLTDFITAFYFVAILTQQSTNVYTKYACIQLIPAYSYLNVDM